MTTPEGREAAATRQREANRRQELADTIRDRIILQVVGASENRTVRELRDGAHVTASEIRHDIAEKLRRMPRSVAIEDVDGEQKITGNHGYPNRLWIKLEDVLHLLGENL